MFNRILIANRGEIARRITRSARAMGVEVVAIYSDADAGAAHVAEADMAVRFLHKGVTDRPSDLLSDAPICVCAAPDIAAQIETPQDVLRFRLLKDRGEPVWHDWLVSQGITDAPPDTGWRMRPMLAVEAAVHGYGVLMASEECLHADLSSGRLVRIFRTDLQGGTFHLVYGRSGPRSKAARVFRRWLLEATARFRETS